MAYLKVSGTKIVNQNGEEVILRGAGLGGWMKWVSRFLPPPFILLTRRTIDSMENFISGRQSHSRAQSRC